ncbi:MAG: hypothetical protein JNK82_29920 [Myxococcaceae bacterium]|nr:hypothetical protein [Myxococcaceae bacterium]
MKVSFHARAEPLQPQAIAATGAHRHTLARRLLQHPDEHLARMTGVTTAEAMVVLGPTPLLPWFDGALYLGAQGLLLLPTWAEPDVHPQLLEKAVRLAMPALEKGPLALVLTKLDEAPLVVPLTAARPLSRERLSEHAGVVRASRP